MKLSRLQVGSTPVYRLTIESKELRSDTDRHLITIAEVAAADVVVPVDWDCRGYVGELGMQAATGKAYRHVLELLAAVTVTTS